MSSFYTFTMEFMSKSYANTNSMVIISFCNTVISNLVLISGHNCFCLCYFTLKFGKSG